MITNAKFLVTSPVAYYYDGNRWIITETKSQPIGSWIASNDRPLTPKENDWYQSKITKIYYIYKHERWCLLDLNLEYSR